MIETYAETLLRRGFDPDLEVEETECSFTLDQALASLGETRRSHPVSVRISNSGIDHPSFEVVVDLARPIWYIADQADEDLPDWFFDGWILAIGKPVVTRIRLHVSSLDDPQLIGDGLLTWQRYTGSSMPLRRPQTVLSWS